MKSKSHVLVMIQEQKGIQATACGKGIVEIVVGETSIVETGLYARARVEVV